MKIEHARYLADSEVSIRMKCKEKSGAKIKRNLTVCVLYNTKRHHCNGRIVNVFIENSQKFKTG